MTAELQQWRGGRAWFTNLVLCALGIGLVLMARQFLAEQQRFHIGFSGVSGWSDVLYVAAISIVLTQPVNRATLWIVLGFAVAMRAVVLFQPPSLSTDIYRYVWDGIVQHGHISPYRYVPADHALAALQQRYPGIYEHINRKEYAHTIYPPIAQMIYWLITLFSPTVQAMKIAMFGFECVTACALIALLRLMGRRTTDVLLYAWCPLLVWEIGAAGHVDAVIMGFVALALLFRYREQPVLTGLFLGLAVMTKFYPLVLLPALWQRRDWKMPVTVVAACAAGYAVYAPVGKLVFGFLAGYANEEGLDTGTRYFVLDWVQRLPGMAWFSKTIYVAACAVVMLGICWWAWRHASRERLGRGARHKHPAYVGAALMLAFALMLEFSPHYPWYIAWLVVFLPLIPELPVLAYVVSFFYLFTTALAVPGPAMFLLNERMYAVVLIAMVVGAVCGHWRVWRWFDARAQRHAV